MIISDDGRVAIRGDVLEIMADVSSIIKALHQTLKESDYDEEQSREIIATCGRLAFVSEKEIQSEMNRLCKKLFDEKEVKEKA